MSDQRTDQGQRSRMIRRCVCISLDYVLNRGGAREMAGLVRLSTEPDRYATEAEILTHATICKAKGFEVIPSCDNHDARGYCTGHEDEARDR